METKKNKVGIPAWQFNFVVGTIFVLLASLVMVNLELHLREQQAEREIREYRHELERRSVDSRPTDADRFDESEATNAVEKVKANPTSFRTKADPWTVAVVSQTLWAEARGEGFAGIDAVASVIVKRAKKNGTTVGFECLKPKQFSCWNKSCGRVNVRAWHFGKTWRHCVEVAEQVANGTFKATIDADHYYAYAKCSPKWAKKLTGVRTIGRHRFGNCK